MAATIDAEPAPRAAPMGAWPVLKRVYASIGEDNVGLVAAGLALYALLATFPALFASVSIFGLVADASSIAGQTESIASALPAEALQILREALETLARDQTSTLTFGFAIGVLLALWSARQGMAAVMSAMNIVFHLEEKRGLIERTGVSLGLTLAAIVGFILLVLLAVVVPVITHVLGTSEPVRLTLLGLRWAVLWGAVVLGLGVVYRFAPNRAGGDWRWISYGSATAATIWLMGSMAFAQYVSRFGSYGETYGALGGVVILLLWFYLSGWAVLLGAEIDSALEPGTTEPSDGSSGPQRT